MKKAISEFLRYQEIIGSKSRNTIISYGKDLFQMADYLSEYDISSIKEQHIRAFLADTGNSGVSKRSINRKLSAIKSLFYYLVSKKFINSNPALLLSGPKYSKKLPTVLASDEIELMMNAVDVTNILGIRDRAILELLYSSGMRASELLSLSEYLIDFTSLEARVVGKGSKERIVFFNDISKEWLLKYISEKSKEYKNYSKGMLFVNSKGMELTDRSLRRIVKEYAVKAAIPKDVSPHTLRHSFATYMLEQGVDIRIIQELLGHASITSTQIYTYVSKEELRRAYSKYHPFANIEL